MEVRLYAAIADNLGAYSTYMNQIHKLLKIMQYNKIKIHNWQNRQNTHIHTHKYHKCKIE